jgi:hypothetical protein
MFSLDAAAVSPQAASSIDDDANYHRCCAEKRAMMEIFV